MELLQRTAKNHSKPEKVEKKDIKLQDHKKALKENKVDQSIGHGELKCAKCERIVSINDTLDKQMEKHKKTYKHCAIIQYDSK